MEYKLFIDGQWVAGGPALEVRNKYTGEVIGAVPTARREDVDAAIAAAERARQGMAEMPTGAGPRYCCGRRACCASAATTWRARSRPRPARRSSSPAPKWTVPSARSPSPLKRPSACTARPCRWMRCRRRRLLRLLDPAACRRDRRHQPVQFPAEPGGAQGGPGPGGGQYRSCSNRPAPRPLTAVKLCQVLDEAGLPAGRPQPGGGLGRHRRRMAGDRSARGQDHLHRQPAGGRAHFARGRASRKSRWSWATPRR